MPFQDLQVTLTGKDVSASDTFRALANNASTATKSASDSFNRLQENVSNATARVEASTRRQESAAATLRVALLRLYDTRKTAEAGSTALIAAEEKVAAAQRGVAAAADSAQRAQERLTRAQSELRASGQSAATDYGDGFGSKLASWAQSGLAGVLGGIAASVTSSVMNVAANAGDAILSQLKSSVIDYNAQLEQATIGFTTMLGSGTKATAFLKELQQFAKTTPFEFGDLTSYAQQMMAYGISTKNVVPYLTALGDAAAGAGKSGAELGNAVLAFEQMAARGKVDLGDLNQLTNAGVPALAVLAEKYGVTKGALLKMISTGKIASSDALPKLIDGLEKGTKSTAAFGGMMDKQSATFNGAMSNISDAMNQTLSTAFKPFYQVAERAALALANFAGSNGITDWANRTSKSVGGFVRIMGRAFREIFNDPKVSKSAASLFRTIGTSFGSFAEKMKASLPNFIKFGKEELPAILDGVTKIVEKLPQMGQSIQDMSKILERNAPGIATLTRTLGGLVGGISDVISWITNAINKADEFQKYFPAVIAQGAVDAANAVKGLPGQFGVIGEQIVSGLINGVAHSWDRVTGAINTLVQAIPSGVRKLLGIASPSKVFQQIGLYVGQGLQKGLLGSTGQVTAAASTMATALRDAFSNKQVTRKAEQAGLAEIKAMTDANSRLSVLAKQRTALQDKISNLKADRAGVYNDVTNAIRGYGDVTGFGYTGDAVQGLRALVTKTKTFTIDLKSLSKRGVSGTMLQQLVDGWNSDPDTALSTASGLLANPSDLRQILALNKELASAGAGLGSYASGAQYDSQINAATGKSKVIGWQMQAAARAGLQQVSRDLHVHVNVNGIYAGTKDDLAKSIQSVIRDAIRKGTIPKNWATA